MKNPPLMGTLALLALGALAAPLLAVSAKYQDAQKARIENGYAVVELADGSKTMVPLSSLSAGDRAWLTSLSAQSPLAHGNSVVQVVTTQIAAKKTIAVSTLEGPLETVQLVAPNVERDQIGGTCMVYARVHWLDIAGYYVDNVDIYKVINNTDPDKPWTNPMFYRNMDQLVMHFSPKVHRWSPKVDAFEWTRQEIRKGRPVLAAFPREIWQDLPPGFVSLHPWSGGNVGHQIVINGFTWNRETHEGTFHIVNSWQGLFEFDLKTEAARGAMDVELSMSPKGEAADEVERTTVTKVILLKSIGKTNLYEVDTNNGVERVAAADENTARRMVEGSDPRQ
jgi:hypothetical protein